MNRIITICAAVLMTASMFAQSPEKMSYQAVVRDGSDALVSSTAVGMQISILQGTSTGTAVYVETQTQTTNANGLVSLEIGSGTVLSGDFTTIDWANGSYFIKTETDPSGGTNYSIIGTSQLMSVPYALHAKTAASVDETDPAYTQSEAANITAIDITNLSNLSGTNTGDQDLSGYLTAEADPAVAANFDFTDAANGDLLQFNGTKWVKVTPDYISDYTVTETDVTAHEAALSVTESQITDLGAYIESETDPTVTKYSVGDFAQGGIVFWLDEIGQHGLVAAKVDQDGGSGIQWHNGSDIDTEAHGDGVYAGEMNTMLIIANQGSNSNDYAAGVCANYTVTVGGVTYGAWYLPSKEELNLMYQNKDDIDATAGANEGSGFASAYYWSSTENNNNSAWIQLFGNGFQFYFN